MNLVDVMVLVLLAFADVCLMVHLRRRRARYLRMDRMTRSLELHLRRQLSPEILVAPRRREWSHRAG